ncbi:MAG TPA: hypothetical protein VFQ00_02165 [Terriglobales bacterium]|nr:hypothetical protein [Terriglobales bacterium]
MNTWLQISKFVRGKSVSILNEYEPGANVVDDRPLRSFVRNDDGKLEDVTEHVPVGDENDRWILANFVDDPFQPKSATAEPPQPEERVATERPAVAGRAVDSGREPTERPAVAGRAVESPAAASDDDEDDQEDSDEEVDGYDHLQDAIKNMLKRPMPGEAESLPESLPNLCSQDLRDLQSMGPRDAFRTLTTIEAYEELEEMRALARQKAARISNLAEAQSAPRCVHRKSDGTSCGSPAMYGQVLCYYHEKSRPQRYEHRGKPFEFPVLEDPRSLQIAITRICELLVNNNLDAPTARALIYGIRTAQRTFVQEGL